VNDGDDGLSGHGSWLEAGERIWGQE
jgi:hypothetical protein